MKSIFQRWLAFFVAIAFIATAIIFWISNTTLAKKNAAEILRLNLGEVGESLEMLSTNYDKVARTEREAALAKVKYVAYLIQERPEYLESDEAIEELAHSLNVMQLHIVDENGIVERSYPAITKGYDMNSKRQSREFMPAIHDPDFELVQMPQPQGLDKKYVQYTGIHRLDKDGIVQVGRDAAQLAEMAKLRDPRAIVELIHIGRHGGMLLSPLLGGSEDFLLGKDVVNGRKCMTMSRGIERYLFTAYIPYDEIYASRSSMMIWLLIANLLLFIVVYALVAKLLQAVVLKGVDSLNASLKKIADGDLNEKVEIESSPEFVSLSTSVNATVDALKAAIEREAKRIDDELETAKAIQRSMLPTNFPNDPDFKLAASMVTAKEVGGDLYDFFQIDDERYAAYIADVSGKGVPAGLFMTSSKMLFRQKLLGRGKKTLGEAIAEANAELCIGNESAMFLTAFFVVINVVNGKMSYVDAGHNPPLFRRASGKWEYLKPEPSLILAIDPDQEYPTSRIQLEPGDQLFLYTDGVSEALNPQKECFGEERLLDVLNAIEGDPSYLVKEVQEAVSYFAQGADQSDDITQLAIRWK